MVHAPRNRIRATQAGAALALGVAFLVGCTTAEPRTPNGGGGSDAEASLAPECADGSVIRPVTAAPYVHIVAGIDISTSYPAGVRRAAQTVAAEHLVLLAQPGPGALIQVNFIGTNSYHLQNSALEISIRAAAPPDYAAKPAEARNPLDARERKRRQQDLAKWCQTAITENQKLDAALEQARAAARAGAEALRSLNVPSEPGSDFSGFFARVSERFAHDPQDTIKIVLLASDAEPWPDATRVDRLPLLTGVRLAISQWATNPTTAATIRKLWNDRFAEAGVTKVDWFVHGESLAPLFRDLFVMSNSGNHSSAARSSAE